MLRLNKFWFRSLPTLSVKSKLFLVVSFVATLILAAFAVVDYEHEKNTLEMLHQELMQRGPAVLGSAIEEHQQHLAIIRTALSQTSSTHMIHWGITVVVLVLVLHWAVSRIVIRPTQQIMAGLNVIELGTWSPGLVVRSGDELGELTRKLNEVGAVVSRHVNEWRCAERLSALALVSNSVSGELEQGSKAIRAVARTLRMADASNGPADFSNVILEAEAMQLEAVETTLNEEFTLTLEGVRAGKRDEEGQ